MNIHVGNLAREVAEDELRRTFEAFGQVTAVNIITDRSSGVSRGFGFVEMPDKAEAQAAIAGLHMKELGGRTLDISEARPPRWLQAKLRRYKGQARLRREKWRANRRKKEIVLSFPKHLGLRAKISTCDGHMYINMQVKGIEEIANQIRKGWSGRLVPRRESAVFNTYCEKA